MTTQHKMKIDQGTTNDATAIVLAAGMGTRMKSALPKPLHCIGGQPMLRHVIDAASQVASRIVVVVSPDSPELKALTAPHTCVIQENPRGTGDAARAADAVMGDGDVIVLCADNPLIRAQTLKNLRDSKNRSGARLALLAMQANAQAHYGRLITQGAKVLRVVEWKDASPEERASPLCNAGVYWLAASDLRRWLGELTTDNAQSEYYLTDIIALAAQEGDVCYALGDEAELAGINSRHELAKAERHFQERARQKAMDEGATLIAPETVFFSADTHLYPDVIVEPHVIFGPSVTVHRGSVIRAFSHLEGCSVGENARIGPYARLRPGTVCQHDTHVGNFVELKAVTLDHSSKVNHLSYLGDADIGAKTNIGAGTITCNYDGVSKHLTVIGSDVFVGSDSVLVAPVKIGEGAFIAAGSVITADVPADGLAFARSRQEIKEGRAKELRKKFRAKKEHG